MLADPTLVSSDTKDIAVRSIHIMASGTRADFDALIHPRAIDRENTVQPPSSRVPGPAGFYATALWLRAAFANLHYDIHEVIASGDLVAVNSTMNGRHVAPMVLYTADGKVDAAFPPSIRGVLLECRCRGTVGNVLFILISICRCLIRLGCFPRIRQEGRVSGFGELLIAGSRSLCLELVRLVMRRFSNHLSQQTAELLDGLLFGCRSRLLASVLHHVSRPVASSFFCFRVI